jgi:WD40 repeat protein
MKTFDPAKAKPAGEHPVDTPLMSCAYDPGGRFLFAGGRDPGLVVVDLEKKETRILSGHESWIGSLARAADGVVLSADYAGKVIAWDCRGPEPQPQWTVEAHPATIHALAVSPDGTKFATADRDGLVRIWRTNDGRQTGELPRIDYPAYGVALHPDGRRIVTADRQPQKPRIKTWEITTGAELLSIDVPELSGYRRVEDIEWGGIRALEISPDGSRLVACGRNGYDGMGCAILYDSATGKLERQLDTALKGGFIYQARFHPGGCLVTAGGDIGKGELRFWDPDKGESLAVVSTAGPGTALDLHPDGLRIAVALTIGKGSYPDAGKIAQFEAGA